MYVQAHSRHIISLLHDTSLKTSGCFLIEPHHYHMQAMNTISSCGRCGDELERHFLKSKGPVVPAAPSGVPQPSEMTSAVGRHFAHSHALSWDVLHTMTDPRQGLRPGHLGSPHKTTPKGPSHSRIPHGVTTAVTGAPSQLSFSLCPFLLPSLPQELVPWTCLNKQPADQDSCRGCFLGGQLGIPVHRGLTPYVAKVS